MLPVDQRVDAADGAQDAVKLAAGQAEAQQVDRLEFDPPLLEPPLGLFRVEAFFLSEKLNIHRISSAFWVSAAAQTHASSLCQRAVTVRSCVARRSGQQRPVCGVPAEEDLAVVGGPRSKAGS